MDTSESGASTPNNSRFTAKADTLEDRLKAETVGLVQLSDFRKRRAEALEASQDASAAASQASTPDGRELATKAGFKKRKKVIKKIGLSFADDDEGDESSRSSADPSRSSTPALVKESGSNHGTDSEAPTDGPGTTFQKRAFKPNASVTIQPKSMTKSALLRETQLKEALKKEYAQIQEAVKATEFMIPFVFYDGKTIPGGMCRMKKGDFIWLFLDRARKLGADLASRGDHSKRDWARIGVDDLIVVKGDLIIPHHYDFHYFIVNRTVGYHGPLFPYSSEPTSGTPAHLLAQKPESASAMPKPKAAGFGSHLQTAVQRREQAASAAQSGPKDAELEGFGDDAGLTKVVDRRWYERNKHIYPASTWEEFDPQRDYTSGVRKDAGGNPMFFSR